MREDTDRDFHRNFQERSWRHINDLKRIYLLIRCFSHHGWFAIAAHQNSYIIRVKFSRTKGQESLYLRFVSYTYWKWQLIHSNSCDPWQVQLSFRSSTSQIRRIRPTPINTSWLTERRFF